MFKEQPYLKAKIVSNLNPYAKEFYPSYLKRNEEHLTRSRNNLNTEMKTVDVLPSPESQPVKIWSTIEEIVDVTNVATVKDLNSSAKELHPPPLKRDEMRHNNLNTEMKTVDVLPSPVSQPLKTWSIIEEIVDATNIATVEEQQFRALNLVETIKTKKMAKILVPESQVKKPTPALMNGNVKTPTKNSAVTTKSNTKSNIATVEEQQFRALNLVEPIKTKKMAKILVPESQVKKPTLALMNGNVKTLTKNSAVTTKSNGHYVARSEKRINHSKAKLTEPKKSCAKPLAVTSIITKSIRDLKTTCAPKTKVPLLTTPSKIPLNQSKQCADFRLVTQNVTSQSSKTNLKLKIPSNTTSSIMNGHALSMKSNNSSNRSSLASLQSGSDSKNSISKLKCTTTGAAIKHNDSLSLQSSNSSNKSHSRLSSANKSETSATFRTNIKSKETVAKLPRLTVASNLRKAETQKVI